jgi:hypothetical protein
LSTDRPPNPLARAAAKAGTRRTSTQSEAKDTRWGRLVAPTGRHGRAALGMALETVVVTVLALGLCRLLSPHDPLLLETGFPWPWLLPILLALRYGTVVGVSSGMIVLGAWQVFYGGTELAVGASAAAGLFPRGFFLGGFITVMLTGQFGDIWIGRLRHARISNQYLAERLSILTKNQFLLRISHERLEQDLLAKPSTLRDSLTRMRLVTLEAAEVAAPGTLRGAAPRIAGAQRFLETAAQACQLEAAQVFAWHDGRLVREASGRVGSPFELDPHDPLVRYAVERMALAHIQTPELQQEVGTRYLICVPLTDATQTLVGAVVVQRMPFLALTRENLQFLLVLCGYFADGVRHADVTREILAAFPDCPYDFALDLARLAHLRQETQVASSLVALVFSPSERTDTLFDHVLRTRRALDVQWPIRHDGWRLALNLMPLAGEAAVDGYALRIEENLQAQFGVNFETAGVVLHSIQIPAQQPGAALRQFLQRCHAFD